MNSNGPVTSEPAVTRSVFVGDLSFFCTEIDLATIFSPFGRIDCVEIKRGRYGDSLMHGFVEYESEISAQLAIKEMHGKKFMGRTMRVNRTNVKVQPNPDLGKWVQLHVNFQSQNLSAKVTEEFLENIFLTFGSIGDITVKRHICSRDPAQLSGYAFVYFLDAYAALRATHAVKGVCVQGINIDCCLSFKAEQALLSQSGLPAGMIKQSSSTATGGRKHEQKGGKQTKPLPLHHHHYRGQPHHAAGSPTSTTLLPADGHESHFDFSFSHPSSHSLHALPQHVHRPNYGAPLFQSRPASTAVEQQPWFQPAQSAPLFPSQHAPAKQAQALFEYEQPLFAQPAAPLFHSDFSFPSVLHANDSTTSSLHSQSDDDDIFQSINDFRASEAWEGRDLHSALNLHQTSVFQSTPTAWSMPSQSLFSFDGIN